MVYGPDGIPLAVLKTCASELAPCLGKLFLSLYFDLPFMLKTCAHSACAEGDPPQPSNYLPISLTSVFLKFSNSSLTGRFEHFSILLILSLIASMTFVRSALLVIFFPFSLTLGPPLFSISVNLLCSRWTYRKLSIESGTNL